MADEPKAGDEEIDEEGAFEELEDEHVEEESILTEYDTEEFVSGAVCSPESSIPTDLFEFEHSFGYDCQKYFNICPCDETVICFASGSIITFMDVVTKQTWFKRTTTGGSVGNITSYRVDPNYRIAIAECREGDRDPLIILYTWPQMEIDAVLRDGTTNAYSIMDFSPDGELLASVGKEPDYNLTIWNWKRHKILLRTSAFTYDVNSVMFSKYCPGQLTTAGAAHIKFWKMARTFTGLKLKGELGRFGKTEICDVLGVYPMPDEKVLSGCEWGNILVWEAGLVKLEVTQRGRKPCHKAPVIQFLLSSVGFEVTTIARDGCVRAWYWDTVEQADPPEDDQYVELNPVAETCVPDCQIMCLKHQKDMNWYAQDGNGGIWIVDLELDKYECEHHKVQTYHASGIVGMAALRTQPVLITAGQDGALQAYNTETHALLVRYVFPAAITCLLYPPVDVDETSRILMVGFADGVMRTLLLDGERLLSLTEPLEHRVHSADTVTSVSVSDFVSDDYVQMISLLKPHSASLTQITMNEQRTLVITCGRDSTIFMYRLQRGTPFVLDRLGYIDTPNNIEYMTWKPGEERVLLLCGQVGFVMEAVLPDAPLRKYSDITTFKLDFDSSKEILVKKHFMRHRPFPEEEDLASIDEEALKAAAEMEKDDDEEEEWIGEIQLMESESMLGTKITWAQYTEEGIWVVQKETGALLLVKPGTNNILKYAPIPGSWCDDITYLKFVCEGRYILIGTNTGYIRMLAMPTEEEDSPEHHYTIWINAQKTLLKKLKGRRLAKEEKQPIPRIDFEDTYYLPMHDRYTGAITCMEFTSDGKRLFTCGADGNIFSYAVNFPEPLIEPEELPPPARVPSVQKIKEPSSAEGELMSHEQLKQKEEYDKMMAIANAHKKRVRNQLAELSIEYNKLIKANRMLPVSQQIDVTLDPRPLVVQEQELAEAKALTIRKLAHQLEASDLGLHKMYSRNIVQCDVFPFVVKAIRDPQVQIRPLRQKNLSKAFYDQLEEVYQKMAEAALRGRSALDFNQKTDKGYGEVEGRASRHSRAQSSLGASQDTGTPTQSTKHRILFQAGFEWEGGRKPRRALMGPTTALSDRSAVITEVMTLPRVDRPEVDPSHTKDKIRAESVTRRAGARKQSWGPPRVASFLLGLPPHPPHPLKKALRNYHQRLTRHHMQLIEWQEHLSRKPDPHAMPPGAAEALKEAEATIGNRVLKSHPDYIAPPGHNTQLRVCLARKEVYDTKRAFNEKVLELREQKVRLVKQMKNIGERLAEIRLEIPAKLAKSPPVVPEIDEDMEFPEKNLEIKPEPMKIKEMVSGKKGRQPQERRTSLQMYPQPRVRQPRVPKFVPLSETRPLTATWELLKARPDIESSALEDEVRQRRVERHLYEQDILIADAEVSIQKFDSRLRQLQRERIRVQEKNQLLELQLYKLHREMNVLNRFEAHEDRLAERVHSKYEQVLAVKEQIMECERQIEEAESEKEDLDVACQDMQHKFKKLVQDTKFADFLRRIFKKKYKPPRDVDEDMSESSESSSSSSEEDEGSLDSRDIGPIRLDPNVCPEGCDREVYDKTYEMRDTRHKYEQEMMEKDHLIELLRRDIEAHNKIKKKLSVQLDKRKSELREFMMEKQSCMNEVDQVVILRYDQIRASAFKKCSGPEGLSQTLVFPERMLMRLRQRVIELQEEIKQQKQRQKINKTHLFRMNVDLRAMEAQAEEMRAQMRDVLTRKLGKPRKVDKTLDDLLRQMARRHKFSTVLEDLPQIYTQLRNWRERHGNLEKKYLSALERNSESLRLAAALQADVLPQKPQRDIKQICGDYTPAHYQRDVVRLRIIRSQQQHEIKALSSEINTLRLKPLSPRSALPSAIPPQPWQPDIKLFVVPQDIEPIQYNYFPITPLGSKETSMSHLNIMQLLFDCLDAMRVSRDEAHVLLKDLTDELPHVISGVKTRYEVVDVLMKKWRTKTGGDPALYKKHTRAFDSLAALADRLIREHVNTLEGALPETNILMEKLEEALKDIADESQPLHARLGRAIAALFSSVEYHEDLLSIETMTTLVNSLVDKKLPLSAETIDRVEPADVIQNIIDCGTEAPYDVIETVVKMAIECLRMQLVTGEEAKQIEDEIDQAMSITASVTPSTDRSSRTSRSTRTARSTDTH